jgi:hypothetical protein
METEATNNSPDKCGCYTKHRVVNIDSELAINRALKERYVIAKYVVFAGELKAIMVKERFCLTCFNASRPVKLSNKTYHELTIGVPNGN